MPDYAYPLIATRHDGKTYVAHTIREAIAMFAPLGAISDNLLDRCVTRYVTPDGHEVYEEGYRFNHVIVRDDEGRVVHDRDIPLPERANRPRYLRRLDEKRLAAERGLPIPGTGCRRNSRYYRRYARNITMRAQDFALELDLEEWGVEHLNVGGRRAKNLPKWGDDVPGRMRQRSWKTQRATQWR